MTVLNPTSLSFLPNPTPHTRPTPAHHSPCPLRLLHGSQDPTSPGRPPALTGTTCFTLSPNPGSGGPAPACAPLLRPDRAQSGLCGAETLGSGSRLAWDRTPMPRRTAPPGPVIAPGHPRAPQA